MRLQHLSLAGNWDIRPSEAELRQLLQALPELRSLNLTHTGIDAAASVALKAAAAERGLKV